MSSNASFDSPTASITCAQNKPPTTAPATFASAVPMIGAAVQFGMRACWAMELEPRYVDASVKRWEDYTGGQARRE